jgi:5-formyltetrahydrofolate cyclo-ligase
MAKRPKGSVDTSDPDSVAPASYSSPACYLHEFDEAGAASPMSDGSVSRPGMSSSAIDAELKSWGDIRQWRKRTREALIAGRLALGAGVRQAKGERAKQRMLAEVDLQQYTTLGIYWSMRGEIDVRDIARKHIEAGGVVGLPVVVAQGAPVEFWKWTPGMGMRRGTWNIPVPIEREVLAPDAFIVPLVGFDPERYRLGYGGGYYDRTLAVANRRPFCIGLGYAEAFLPSIYPQAHDIPMNLIVTD